MNQDHLRLGLSFAGSLAVNALVLAPVAVVVFTATPSSALDVDTTLQAQIAPPSMDDIELGIDESDASTMTWVGYETYLEHLARQAEFEQAQLQAAKGERASGEPLATPVTPPPTPTTQPVSPQQPPQDPAEPTEPAPEPPLETPQVEPVEPPGESPPAAAPPDTVGLPIDPESMHPGLPADIPGAPQPGRQSDDPGPVLSGETPEVKPESTPEPTPPDTPEQPLDPAPEPTPPQPEQPPTTPNVPPSPTPTESTSEPDPTAPKGVKGVTDAPLRLDGSDRDSDATSLIKVTRRKLNLGHPIAREGLKLYPRKPDFTSLQVVSSGGKRGILARLVFKTTGHVRNGRMLPVEAYIGHEALSGPDKGTVRWSNDSRQLDRLEQSIHTVLFSWSATGRRIDELQEDAPVIINLELQIAVK